MIMTRTSFICKYLAINPCSSDNDHLKYEDDFYAKKYKSKIGPSCRFYKILLVVHPCVYQWVLSLGIRLLHSLRTYELTKSKIQDSLQECFKVNQN